MNDIDPLQCGFVLQRGTIKNPGGFIQTYDFFRLNINPFLYIAYDNIFNDADYIGDRICLCKSNYYGNFEVAEYYYLGVITSQLHFKTLTKKAICKFGKPYLIKMSNGYWNKIKNHA